MRDAISGKRVPVTGADGFIGSHLVELLASEGAKAAAFACCNSWNEIGWLRELPAEALREVEVLQGDIRDGLARTYHWICRNLRYFDPGKFTP